MHKSAGGQPNSRWEAMGFCHERMPKRWGRQRLGQSTNHSNRCRLGRHRNTGQYIIVVVLVAYVCEYFPEFIDLTLSVGTHVKVAAAILSQAGFFCDQAGFFCGHPLLTYVCLRYTDLCAEQFFFKSYVNVHFDRLCGPRHKDSSCSIICN